jgi:hypothetical protein
MWAPESSPPSLQPRRRRSRSQERLGPHDRLQRSISVVAAVHGRRPGRIPRAAWRSHPEVKTPAHLPLRSARQKSNRGRGLPLAAGVWINGRSRSGYVAKGAPVRGAPFKGGSGFRIRRARGVHKRRLCSVSAFPEIQHDTIKRLRPRKVHRRWAAWAGARPSRVARRQSDLAVAVAWRPLAPVAVSRRPRRDPGRRQRSLHLNSRHDDLGGLDQEAGPWTRNPPEGHCRPRVWSAVAGREAGSRRPPGVLT